MAKPLRVLIVEDSEDDALLVIRELERGGYDTTFERVETAETMTAALEKQAWDIIIADYKLPHFSAPEALELFHQSGLDLPFIVISGTIGEETAVAMMKAGAHDYLMKGNLKRLAPAIKRELHEAEARKEHKLVQEELQIAEQNFRNSLDNSPLGIRIVTAEGELLYANQTMLDIYGYSGVEKLEATPTKKRYTPKSYAEHQKRQEKRKQGKPAPTSYEISIVCKDGGIRHLIASRKAVVWGDEVQYQVIYQDITERKQAEEKIKQVAEEWRITFDSITDLVSIHDKDLRIIRVNKAFADAVNMRPEELVGKTCYQLVHGTSEPVPTCPHMKTLETKEPAVGEFLEPHLGMYLEVATSPICNENGEVVASVHLIRDITRRKKMEEQLITTDRLASIGELASGIAHELNNPLTSVIGFSELLLNRDVPDDIKEDLKVINKEAQRTARVVRNLLVFARGHSQEEKKLVNVNKIIENVLELRAYDQKINNIQVDTRFATDLPEITADDFQLYQVFLNIIINAEHAMLEAHGQGTITITTERDGDIIRVSLTDDGPGISEENLGHIFDPFFTTKEVGKGTGLGLSICHGTITEHGGKIYAKSELGKGTTFIIELPVATTDNGGTTIEKS